MEMTKTSRIYNPCARPLDMRSPKRVCPPGEPQSPQRLRHGVRKESEAAFLDSFRTPWPKRDSGCEPSIPQEEFLGPSGPKLETELKMSSRSLLAPGPKKLTHSRKRVKKVEKELKFPLFDSLSTLFLTFWAPGPEGPGNSFSTLVPTLGPKGQKLLWGGLRGRKTLGLAGAGGLMTPPRTLFGRFWGSGPEGPGRALCQAGGFPNHVIQSA